VYANSFGSSRCASEEGPDFIAVTSLSENANVDRKGTRAAAEAYLQFLYTDEAQEIIAKHYYRPTNETILKKHRDTFPEMRLFVVTDIGENWDDVRKKLVGDGSVFDTIYKPKGK